ncbi:hypothetical protein C8R44DRAFT_543740, partial [Mycena epipterygia]
IKGYSKLRILMMSEEGEILETEAEPYVVKGMSVPILLGEDFQLNYELGVTRNVELGTKIIFRGTEHEVAALGRAKAYRRAKVRCQWKRKRMGQEECTIRAAEDCKIHPHSSVVLCLAGNFKEDKEWLVDMNLLANADDSLFGILKTLITARRPCVPVSNMSDRTRIIRKGEILGKLIDPQEFFDKPGSDEGLEDL